MSSQSTIDAAEVARFSAIAAEWWEAKGKFAPLHAMNPARLSYLRARACAHFFPGDVAREASMQPLAGLRVLDIGCGGGLMAEPLARLGAEIVAIDAAPTNISVASLHAEEMGLRIDYRATTAEALAAGDDAGRFDLVLALEIIEHVADVALFYDSVAKLVRPGGMVMLSTLNRTPKSYAMGIIGAEYLLRWLPRGTHQWDKFVKPEELDAHLIRNGFEITEQTGLVYNPLGDRWTLSADMDVNYMMIAARP